MARETNFGALTATNTEASAASSTATATGIAGKALHVVGFDGGSSDQAYKIELKFGSTVKLTMRGLAGTSTGRELAADNPLVAADGETVTVVTTPAASGNCTANLIYKIGF